MNLFTTLEKPGHMLKDCWSGKGKKSGGKGKGKQGKGKGNKGKGLGGTKSLLGWRTLSTGGNVRTLVIMRQIAEASQLLVNVRLVKALDLELGTIG